MLSDRLYRHSLWEYLYIYRVVLVVLRLFEIIFISLRFLLFRAPLLIIWTRLPGLRGKKSPYSDLAPILAPARERASMLISDIGAVTLGDCQTKEEVADFIAASRKKMGISRPTSKTIFGGMLRGVFTELGPTFLKLAQILSMRHELPPFLREELQIIQDNLPAMKSREVKTIVDREMRRLGKTMEGEFEWIGENAMASGSLAQVHRAKLRGGEEVALKVQRARLEGIVVIDTVIIVDMLIGIARRVLRALKLTDISLFQVSFRQSLRREVDLLLEACAEEQFMHIFRSSALYSQSIKVAKVHFELTTDKLLAMELVTNFHRFDRLAEMDSDKVWGMLNQKLPGYPDNYSNQMFRTLAGLMGDWSVGWGYQHGDPHLGNMYLLEPHDGYGWRIFLCDWGMVEVFPPHIQYWLGNYYRANMWMGDPQEIIRVIFTYLMPSELAVLTIGQCHLTHVEYSERIRAERKREPMPPLGESLVWWYRTVARRRNVIADTTDTGTPVMLRTRASGAYKGYANEVLEGVFGILPGLLNKHVPPGMGMDRLLSHYLWLMYKAGLYMDDITATLWSGSSWNDQYIHALKEQLKFSVRMQLRDKTVIDIKGYMDEIAQLFKQPAAAEFLKQQTSIEAPK